MPDFQDTDLVYLKFLDLFLRTSWIEERNEVMSYSGSGVWNVDADFHINRKRVQSLWNLSERLNDLRISGEAESRGNIIPIPLLELAKENRDAPVKVTDATGSRIPVHLDETS